MNIFVLDSNIQRCAQYHCDQHVVKMILESTQLLCTALNKMGFDTPYRSTHAKHPCVYWVAASYDNFLWLAELTVELNREYRYRFGRTDGHRSMDVLSVIIRHRYPSRGLTEFAQAMPDAYKVPGDAVAAYRRFYLAEKLSFARWTKRPAPDWVAGVAADRQAVKS